MNARVRHDGRRLYAWFPFLSVVWEPAKRRETERRRNAWQRGPDPETLTRGPELSIAGCPFRQVFGLGGVNRIGDSPRATASHPLGQCLTYVSGLRSPIPLRDSPGVSPGSLLTHPLHVVNKPERWHKIYNETRHGNWRARASALTFSKKCWVCTGRRTAAGCTSFMPCFVKGRVVRLLFCVSSSNTQSGNTATPRRLATSNRMTAVNTAWRTASGSMPAGCRKRVKTSRRWRCTG